MRILFCGTPDYAVPSLRRLAALAPEHVVVGVVSQPDQPKGRSRTPTPPPVVAAARELGIEAIAQPLSINSPEVLEQLRALRPDILCVIAYGKILKEPTLNLCTTFPINAHASLLPRHRGAAPIQAALLAGDSETGVCIMKMEAGLDTGPVLLRRTLPIDPRDTAGTLHDKLAELSAACLVEALKSIAAGSFTLEAQDPARATYAGKIHKDSGRIDWTQPGEFIARQIRAMTPWPGAWASVQSADGTFTQRLRLAEAELEPSAEALQPGSGRATPESLFAGSGSLRALRITRVHPEGKRELSAAEFLRGQGQPLLKGLRWI